MSYRDSEIVVMKSKLEKISKAKDDLETKIEKFENASQSLDKLIGSQITYNSKSVLGYDRCKYHQRERKESDEEDKVEFPPEKGRKTIKPSVDKARWKYHQRERKGHSHKQIEDQGYFENRCSWRMTRNISYLTDFKEFDGRYVAFAGGDKGGKIIGKGIIRTARTPQQNRVAKRRNKSLIENRVLVVKPHFKTPYELFRGRTHDLSFMRPFGCHVTILNTLDHLGKFDGKSDEGLFVGYFTNSKAFRVYNTRTRKVEENLHIKFLENKPLILGDGRKWLFDIDTLTESMNYVPVIAGTNSNDFVGKGASFDAGQSSMVARPNQDYILMPLWNEGSLFDSSSKDSDGDNKDNDGPINTVRLSDDFFSADNDMRSLDGVELDISNVSTTYHVLTTPNTIINKDHSLNNVIGDIQSGGCTKEEEIDYDEVFAPVARIKAIRLLLAYASFMGFLVYQMDFKSAFLYRRIEEEVYMYQPLGFEDPDYSDNVYKVEKALYGLHQAPRACHDKYVDEILRKFKYKDVKLASTPMDKEKALLKDSDGDDVDIHLYRFMIGSLMYLTSSRPDIMFVFWRTTSVRTLDNGEIELNATVDGHDKIITKAAIRRHLKLVVDDCISTLPTTEIFEQITLMGVEIALFPTMLVTKQVSQGKGPTRPVGTQHTPTIIESSLHLQNISITYRKTRTKTGRMDIRIPLSNVPSSAADEAISKEMHDGLGRATTTTSSVGAEQGSGNMSKTQTKATSSRPSSLRTSSEGGSSEQEEAHEIAEHIMDFSTASPQTDDDETLAETLLNIKRSAAKDKGKAIMQESESLKKIKKKKMMQITQIQVDEDLAQRMLEEERESLSIKERSRLLVEFVNKRKKMLAVKRAEEKRSKPPTQAQQRTYMSNYLKNMGGYTLKQLKQYSFEEIKMLFDKNLESIRMFVPMESKGQAADFKVGEGSSKEGESLKISAKEESGQKQEDKEENVQQEDVVAKKAKKESSKTAGGRLKRKTLKAREDKDKRQKKQDDPEKLTLMEYVEVIFDFEKVINVIPLAVKSPIVNWKSYCKGDVGYYEIHRVDESYKSYIFFSEMLNDFDREELIVLHRLFNRKYASTRPGFDDLIL
uniref:Ribonuclease H-like domain-containing protein n=1 Tax=Tanacetum cinerariifolium TaxID=118510 RepID=A0A6L2J836_TANCI|nr:ribonuclease H-like domain-containing protein [Tanacetum cinerariifolium]